MEGALNSIPLAKAGILASACLQFLIWIGYFFYAYKLPKRSLGKISAWIAMVGSVPVNIFFQFRFYYWLLPEPPPPHPAPEFVLGVIVAENLACIAAGYYSLLRHKTSTTQKDPT